MADGCRFFSTVHRNGTDYFVVYTLCYAEVCRKSAVLSRAFIRILRFIAIRTFSIPCQLFVERLLNVRLHCVFVRLGTG